uniref:Uncharacterized protein n=1 Tax=Anguilla anguilla TaxID=7936 RepID=A0A0E9PKU9_ANGAN
MSSETFPLSSIVFTISRSTATARHTNGTTD